MVVGFFISCRIVKDGVGFIRGCVFLGDLFVFLCWVVVEGGEYFVGF